MVKNVKKSVSSIWQDVPSDISDRLENCIDAAHARTRGYGYIFFRADDIAEPGRELEYLVNCFALYRVPLSLAVVPGWMDESKWEYLFDLGMIDNSLWCWHQHGWMHKNHEAEGKKQEFGDNRSEKELREDILNGREKMENLLGSEFCPIFTPPWNRCGQKTLDIVKELGFCAVSRSQGAEPQVPEGLSDFQVNVDLHTRRETDPQKGWDNLLGELETSIASGLCGVMIHHERMNDAAFQFLDLLLHTLSLRSGLYTVHMDDLT